MDAAAAPTTTAAGPLAGLKVLALGPLIAGPFAGENLGDFGAEVIKIEPPGDGDPLRQGTSVWWQVQSRNKQSVVLDLRTPEGRADVAAQADVLTENFRPGTLEKWGLGHDTLAASNPGLIMLRISGYGQTGPHRHLPGFAVVAVVAVAMGGLRHLMGEPGRAPVRAGVSLGDTLAALHGVIGVLLALQARAHRIAPDAPKGRGQVVDVALYESVFNCMESLLPAYSAFGVVRQPAGSALPGIAPKLSATPGSVRSAAPTLGRHTAQVLAVLRRPPSAAGKERG